MTRRSFLPAAGGSALALAGAAGAAPAPARKGRLKQAVTRGVFGPKISKDLEECCKMAAEFGIKGFDLIGPQDWPTLKKYGLLPTMVPGGTSIPEGTNRIENHAKMVPAMREAIEKAASVGAPNVIALSGARKGLPDEKGIENSVIFLNQVKTIAEDKGVTICLELLNSKVNHPDYQCDHTSWGVEVCKRVNSPRVKLLYDIYHMQIMEGDVIRTIKDNIKWLGHFHTGGVPGRHEIDASQELNYSAVAKAIVETGYTGWLSHEYNNPKDPRKALEEALEICDA
jgi:hydroxypyruvate isomerase